MSAGSEAVLYDIFGDPMAVEVDTAIPAGTALLISGGSDGTNARYFKVDSSGNQIMIGLGTAGSPTGGILTIQGDPSGTPAPISGTVTANAGSGNFSVVQATAALLNATVIGTVTANIGSSGALALDATLAKLTITPGTAIGSNTLAMIGGHVTTGSPTYTNGNINPLSLTTAGALRVDGSAITQPVSGTVTANQGGAPWSSNITQFGSVNISTGTGASGTGIPRVTVANDSNILATQSGTWTVQQGTPPWSVVGPGASGAALSGNPVRIAGSDGTNTRNITTDTSGRLLVSGAAADGTSVTGNPVLIGGQDGTNAQSFATDGYGRLQVTITGTSSTTQVEGRAADGAAVTGNPVLIGGFDGTNTQTVLTDTSGRIVIAPSGASTTSGFSFGDVALSSITTSVVRRTTYNEQSTNAQRSIASANANDTSAGTGARQVKITYYDSTGAGPNTETVTLNGTSAVATSNTNICFIEKMEVVSVGSGGVNAGIITLFVNNAGGGGTIGTITASDNRTYWSHHYVPNGKTNFITSLSVVVNGGGALFFVKAKTLNVSTAPEAQISDYVRSATQSGTSTRVYGTPIQTVGPARLLMYVTTEANTSLTYRGAFDFYDE